jgi:hypothetical protein
MAPLIRFNRRILSQTMFLFRPFRSFRGVVRTRDTTGWARLVYALAEGGMGKRRAESNRPPQRLYRAPSMASSRLVHALVEEASGGGPAGSQWQNDQTQIGRRRDYQRQIGRKRVVQYLAQVRFPNCDDHACWMTTAGAGGGTGRGKGVRQWMV